MDTQEIPVVYDCHQCSLIGIIHKPSKPFKTGLLIIVGGPQYRVGSHRQFLLLARKISAAGYPVMRFDYRGKGDSEGFLGEFENINEDIQVTIDIFQENVPSADRIILWGLCDGASASLFYGHLDNRIHGLVLLNPWIRTQLVQAQANRDYYYRRILGGESWKKLFRGQVNILLALKSFLSQIITIFNYKLSMLLNKNKETLTLPDKMAYGLDKFCGKTLFILSGNNDHVAEEFRYVAASSNYWQNLMRQDRVNVYELHEANHTFSSKVWRNEVENITLEFVQSLDQA